MRTFTPVARLGADDVQLDRFADRCETVAAEFDTARSGIAAAATRTFWLGNDAEQFRTTWTTTHGPQLTATARMLGRLARQARLQADQQRRTSSGAATFLGPGTGGGNPPGRGPPGGEHPPGGGPPEGPPCDLSPPPGDGTPRQIGEWWCALTPEQQATAVDQYDLGGVNGLPATIRDAENRQALGDDITRLLGPEHGGTISDADQRVLDNARRVQRYLEQVDARVDPVTGEPVGGQLYIYEPGAHGGDGRVAIATGDLDRAEHVAVAVPGMFTTVQGLAPGRAGNVYDGARWASGDTVAVLDWVGYDAPSGAPIADDLHGVVNQDMAREGARLLAADVEGLRASRTDPAHLTVMGNSYGSTTSAIAADEFGLQADDLVLTGSPGAGAADNAGDLTTGGAHTWVGSNSKDLVSVLGETGWADPSGGVADEIPGVELMGNDPAENDFGALRFQAESVDRGRVYNLEDHQRYYDQDTESLFNIGAIVTGEYDLVVGAGDRDDPWYAPMQDPESDRTPEVRTHE